MTHSRNDEEPRRAERPRRAGRKETARMAAELPPHARDWTIWTMTLATVRVYSALWKFADEGRHDPSVSELVERALCSVTAVQRALTDLTRSGHLAVTRRCSGPVRTNQYSLTYHHDAQRAGGGR